MDPLEHCRETLEVHRFFQTIAHGLADQRVIGNLSIARNVFEARRRIGKYRGQQIVGQHPLQLRRHLLPPRLRGTASEIVVFHRQRV